MSELTDVSLYKNQFSARCRRCGYVNTRIVASAHSITRQELDHVQQFACDNCDRVEDQYVIDAGGDHRRSVRWQDSQEFWDDYLTEREREWIREVRSTNVEGDRDE